MLQLMNDMPANVVGIHATGEVTKDDIDKVVIPALGRMADSTGHIHYLLYLDMDVKHWHLGAWAGDVKTWLKYFTKWNKIAIVSDQHSMQNFANLISSLLPGEAKGFPVAEMEQAKAWVAG